MTEREVAVSANSISTSSSVRSSEQTTRLDNTDTKLQISEYKVVHSGNSIDVYHYELPIVKGLKQKRSLSNLGNNARSDEYKIKSISRARNNVRRLIQTNFKNNNKFITLTFNDKNSFDISNLEVCLKYYKKFIRKLKNIHPSLKYVTVPEFQQRGAVHYHIICNLPYLKKETIQSLWGHGFIQISAIFNSQNAAIYLTKYLSKRFDHKKKLHHRLYYASKNLSKPKTLYGRTARLVAMYLIINDAERSYSSSYQTAHNGKATFTQYNRKYNAE